MESVVSTTEPTMLSQTTSSKKIVGLATVTALCVMIEGSKVIIPVLQPDDFVLMVSREPVSAFMKETKKHLRDPEPTEVTVPSIGKMLIMQQNLTPTILGTQGVSKQTPGMVIVLFF